MTRRLRKNLMSVALLAVFGGVLWLCQDFGPRARMIPQPLAVFGIVLTLIQMAWHSMGGEEPPTMEMISVDAGAIPEGGEGRPREERTEEQLGRWGEAGAFAIVALLVAMVFTAGIFPAVFLFTAGYLILSRHCTPLRGLAWSVAMTLAIYLLFVLGLEMQVYHGLLGQWLG
ncbi:MAG: tripartite tricarboxylate transporter TctB family protein [Betaproteobacteria bacterium]|jgi:hypothetical protein|nr:tripartite tricarboxylate transporter TctB family protein [Betaproteobacteria bacterium]